MCVFMKKSIFAMIKYFCFWYWWSRIESCLIIQVLNCHEFAIYILAPLIYAIVYGCSDATIVLGAGGKVILIHLSIIVYFCISVFFFPFLYSHTNKQIERNCNRKNCTQNHTNTILWRFPLLQIGCEELIFF